MLPDELLLDGSNGIYKLSQICRAGIYARHVDKAWFACVGGHECPPYCSLFVKFKL
jgi:hypothetical protein